MTGETESGDTVRVRDSGAACAVLVADGLGHGPLAAEAAGRAGMAFQASHGQEPSGIIAAIDEALHGTRGAAAAVATIDPARGVVHYCGVGNIAGQVNTDGTARRMVSQNGTAGHGRIKITQFSYPWEKGSLLIMQSDGVQSRWDLASYPGLASRRPGVVAGVLYRDFNRGRDDAAIVVVREGLS
jgi:hypothetical protein